VESERSEAGASWRCLGEKDAVERERMLNFMKLNLYLRFRSVPTKRDAPSHNLP
jgi:hypothetical protein